MIPLLALSPGMAEFWQLTIIGLSMGSLFALIALGYSMVYGIIELINFAHGDVFMLGGALTVTLAATLTFLGESVAARIFAILLILIIVPVFCAIINRGIDWLIYKPLRNKPKLVNLVSALGVSFVLMNIGQFWLGAAPVSVEDKAKLIDDINLLGDSPVTLSIKDAMVIGLTIPIMLALTWLVKMTRMGKAMRATAQNPTAAALMGINVEKVIGFTFFLGGTLAGIASVIYSLKVGSVQYQMGFQNGLFAFTAAVVGGIGNIPGAVLGGLLIGFGYSFGQGYGDAKWVEALIFGVLIVLLIFRPTGLLGARTREKV
jgi:branched-chain amino acid transport system permease protein